MITLQFIGFFLVFTTGLLAFAAMIAANRWWSMARMLCLAVVTCSVALVAPSGGVFAALFRITRVDQEGRCFVYGFEIEPGITKHLIVWDGGWVPLLALALLVCALGLSLLINMLDSEQYEEATAETRPTPPPPMMVPVPKEWEGEK